MKPLKRSKINQRTLALLFALAMTQTSFAQQTPQPAQAPPPASEPAPEGPSYRARSLPTDTFKPSERVSEDYPVAFPADI
ncbi:MAG: hypothetical protein EXR86_12625 [Gammaproteobacteria bacterium]|nr:hypothetical protein [Gammaproteobacteria bacterium]